MTIFSSVFGMSYIFQVEINKYNVNNKTGGLTVTKIWDIPKIDLEKIVIEDVEERPSKRQFVNGQGKKKLQTNQHKH